MSASNAQMVPLGELVRIQVGVPLKSSRARAMEAQAEDALADTTFVISAKALPSLHGIHVKSLTEVNSEIGEQHLLHDGDVLFSNRGNTNYAWVFRAESVHERRCVAGNQFLVLRTSSSPNLDEEYVAWFLNHPIAHGPLSARAHGSSIKLIKAKDLAKVELPLPSLDIQGYIADGWLSYLAWDDAQRELSRATREWIQSMTAEKAMGSEGIASSEVSE